MATLAVIERLDVLEDRGAQLPLGSPGLSVDEFLLQGREEALGDGVVVGVAAGAHRDRDAGVTRGLAEAERDVLARFNRSLQRGVVEVIVALGWTEHRWPLPCRVVRPHGWVSWACESA